ncbi:hypothetical protein ADMFC3_27900 [Geovibrio sp. ADMFC3]|nr:hypothetical protein [Deferribacteraceae bacterium]
MRQPVPFYQDDFVTLYNADCFEIAKELGLQANMVLTDPPYGCTEQKWDIGISWHEFWQMIRNCSKKTAVITFSINLVGCAEAMATSTVPFRFAWHWRKNKGTNHLNKKNQPLRVIEHFPVFCNTTPPYYPQMSEGLPQNFAVSRESNIFNRTVPVESRTGAKDRFPFNVIEDFPELLISCPVVNNDSSDRIHTNQKPIELYEYLILTHTKLGDTVYDGYAGSGNVAKAARNTGRKAVIVEKSTEQCEKIVASLKGEKPHLRPKGLTIEDFINELENEECV